MRTIKTPKHKEVVNFAECRLIELQALLNKSVRADKKSCYHKQYQIEKIILKLALETLNRPPI